MSFENKNLETKIKILFRTEKSGTENNTFWKKKSGREIIVFRKWKFENKNEKVIPDKKIHNIKFCFGKKNPEHIFRKREFERYFICTYFLRTVSFFSLESGAGSNCQNYIKIILCSKPTKKKSKNLLVSYFEVQSKTILRRGIVGQIFKFSLHIYTFFSHLVFSLIPILGIFVHFFFRVYRIV